MSGEAISREGTATRQDQVLTQGTEGMIKEIQELRKALEHFQFDKIEPDLISKFDTAESTLKEWHFALLAAVTSGSLVSSEESDSDGEDGETTKNILEGFGDDNQVLESFELSMSEEVFVEWNAMIPRFMEEPEPGNVIPPSEGLILSRLASLDAKDSTPGGVRTSTGLEGDSVIVNPSTSPPSSINFTSSQESSDTPRHCADTPIMSITPFSPFARRLREAVGTGGLEDSGKPLTTVLNTLGRTPPSPPPLDPKFKATGARLPRDVELKLPMNVKLSAIVCCENLGDLAEEIALKWLFSSNAPGQRSDTGSRTKETGNRTPSTASREGSAGRGSASNAPSSSRAAGATTNLAAKSRTTGAGTKGTKPRDEVQAANKRHALQLPTDDDLIQAAQGKLHDHVIGMTLSAEIQQRISCAFGAMNPIEWSSREADIEYTFQRVIGDILTALFEHIGVDRFYIHHGSSAIKSPNSGGHIPSHRAIPDLEYMLRSTKDENAVALGAVEIKTSQTLKPNFCLTVFRVSLVNAGYLAEQISRFPGFAVRFLWPLSANDSLSNETAILVQVWTAMVVQNLSIMEVSSGGDTSFFVWRRDTKSRTLYISRPYLNEDPDSCGNLTRFAFLYLKIHNLLGELGDRVPTESIEHWKDVKVPSLPERVPGIDPSTSWVSYREKHPGLSREPPTTVVRKPKNFVDLVVRQQRRLAQIGQPVLQKGFGSRGRSRTVPGSYSK